MNNKSYLLTSIGLSVILVMAVVPGVISPQVDAKFYGAAEMILYDIQGNEKFSQTVHNRLVDTGETFLLTGTFADGTTAVADASSIGTICVTDAAQTVAEINTSTTFEAANTLDDDSLDNCIETASVTYSGGIATIGSLTFTANDTTGNVLEDTTIAGIGVCENTGTTGGHEGCANGSTNILFAEIITSSVTLALDESVDITYTFDISSSGT